jgi:hypothetical protein
MALDIDNVGGEPVGRSRGRVLHFPAGRVCQAPGCRTRLSIYNSRSRCAVHDFDPNLVHVRPPAPLGKVHHLPAASRHLASRRRHRAA